MTALRFKGLGSSLDVDLASWDGDAYLTILVDSQGFKGHNDLHVFGRAFQDFCRNLLELQRTLKGEARLVSARSPEELDIVFKPADGLGHIRIFGHTGYEVQADHGLNWHAVHFGFQVDASSLDQVATNQWVRDHAV
jgi:hypothetical protein